MSEPERASGFLAEPTRRLHRALLDALLDEGAVPSPEELAARLEIAVADLPDRLRELAAVDYAAFDGAGRLVCLYPLSPRPTPHSFIINRQRRYAMCAIDALGIPAMLGQELAIEGHCAVCEAPIAMRVRPGAVVAAAPSTAMVVARRDETEPAFAACCPFTVFVCGQDHAGEFATRLAGTHALSLVEALTHAEEIFGDFLADALPATRPRGKQWNSPTMVEPILYTQSGCAESAMVRAWLADRGIAFTERDASSDPEAALALAATGVFATPLLVTGEEKVLGFQPEALAALLRPETARKRPTPLRG